MKFIVRGFDLFKTRDQYAVPDLSLPPLYRVFYSTFEVGFGKLEVPGVFLPQVNQVAGILTQQLATDTDFLLEDFLSLDEARRLIRQTYEAAEVPHNLWPIAECASNKCVLVGTGRDN